jgi:hypothetical protein
MGIFKNLINKVLDAEVPPVVEKLVKKVLADEKVDKITSKENANDDIYSHTESGNRKRAIVEHQETLENTIKDIEASGFFMREKIPSLFEKLRATEHIGYPYKDPFDYNDCLSPDEKKSMGLNTRQKYSREMAEMLTDKGIKQNDPKALVHNIYMQNIFKVSRKYELIELKKMGLKTVKILDCGDERDCPMVKKIAEKAWPIDEVPDLPLPGCTAKYCRCEYIMDEESMSD